MIPAPGAPQAHPAPQAVAAWYKATYTPHLHKPDRQKKNPGNTLLGLGPWLRQSWHELACFDHTSPSKIFRGSCANSLPNCQSDSHILADVDGCVKLFRCSPVSVWLPSEAPSWSGHAHFSMNNSRIVKKYASACHHVLGTLRHNRKPRVCFKYSRGYTDSRFFSGLGWV